MGNELLASSSLVFSASCTAPVPTPLWGNSGPSDSLPLLSSLDALPATTVTIVIIIVIIIIIVVVIVIIIVILIIVINMPVGVVIGIAILIFLFRSTTLSLIVPLSLEQGLLAL
jgi:hypothetical protein